MYKGDFEYVVQHNNIPANIIISNKALPTEYSAVHNDKALDIKHWELPLKTEPAFIQE